MEKRGKKKRFSIIPKFFKGKSKPEGNVKASGVYECSLCGNYTAFKKGETFTHCEDCINAHPDTPNEWYVTNIVIHFMSRNLNIEFRRLSTLETKLAVFVTKIAGKMWFVYFHVIWFVLWILASQGYFGPQYMFDPFPYGLLTMIVSLEAIFLATLIMIGQNIMSRQSELRSELDYDVNLKTEKEVAEMSATLRELKEEQSLIKDMLLGMKEVSRKNRWRKKRKEDAILAGTGIRMMEEDEKEE
jgi:uncharacterized membrane protein